MVFECWRNETVQCCVICWFWIEQISAISGIYYAQSNSCTIWPLEENPLHNLFGVSSCQPRRLVQFVTCLDQVFHHGCLSQPSRSSFSDRWRGIGFNCQLVRVAKGHWPESRSIGLANLTRQNMLLGAWLLRCTSMKQLAAELGDTAV
jgi:hypothetical protein